MAGKKKLVIFPEGEISRQNDTLMPLETGVAQMSFWSLEELQKQGKQEPVFLLPVAIKYTYRSDIREELRQALARLEARLGVTDVKTSSLYERLHAVALAVLSALEVEYEHKASIGSSTNDRLAHLRQYVLNNIATNLQVQLPTGQSPLAYVRILRNTLDDYIYDHTEEPSAYQKQLHEQQTAKIRQFYRDLDRVVNFIAIYEGYLQERMSQERFAEIVDRFETEVFGNATIKGPRLVCVKIGEPLALLDYWEAYKSGKKTTIQKVTDELGQRIYSMLQEMDAGRNAILME